MLKVSAADCITDS